VKKLNRFQHVRFRMLPAQNRLYPVNAAIVERDHWLEEQGELVLIESPADSLEVKVRKVGLPDTQFTEKPIMPAAFQASAVPCLTGLGHQNFRGQVIARARHIDAT